MRLDPEPHARCCSEQSFQCLCVQSRVQGETLGQNPNVAQDARFSERENEFHSRVSCDCCLWADILRGTHCFSEFYFGCAAVSLLFWWQLRKTMLRCTHDYPTMYPCYASHDLWDCFWYVLKTLLCPHFLKPWTPRTREQRMERRKLRLGETS